MVATTNLRKTLPKIPAKKIPTALIYEIMDGKPIYYKGYRDVIAGIKTIEEIMGSSNLQATIVEYFLSILFKNLDLAKYRILTNETGIHLSKKTNFAADIAIYERAILPVKSADKHYIPIPPKIQIEIDIEADTEAFGSPDNYIYAKTEKLLNFGVEKVIWVLSNSKKILVATKDENWQIIDWHKNINLIEDLSFAIGKYLKEEGSPFA
jgi:Uma2 family endonuclease